jgi:hypothetical protein
MVQAYVGHKITLLTLFDGYFLYQFLRTMASRRHENSHNAQQTSANNATMVVELLTQGGVGQGKCGIYRELGDKQSPKLLSPGTYVGFMLAILSQLLTAHPKKMT